MTEPSVEALVSMVELPRMRERRNRADILDGLEPVARWPRPDAADLERLGPYQKKMYLVHRQAVEQYCANQPEKEILRRIRQEHGVELQQGRIWALVVKAAKVNPRTGRIVGLFAVLPGYRPMARKSVDGALGKLFKEHPDIEKEMVKYVHQRLIGDVQVAGISPAGALSRLHQLCQERELHKAPTLSWPFAGSKRRGGEAVRRWMQRVASTRPNAAAKNELGDEAGKNVANDRARLGHVRAGALPRQAFAAVELDEHRFDALWSVLFRLQNGETLVVETTRLWVVVLIETETSAVLAATLCLDEQFDRFDLLRTVYRAFRPPPRIKNLELRNAAFDYDEGACYPGELPEFAGNTWQTLRFDGARSHTTADALERITQVTGCMVEARLNGDPTMRALIEGFFAAITKMAEPLPNATGNSPNSPVRREPEKAATRLKIDLSMAQEVLDVYFRNWNVTPKLSQQGLSPIEMLRLRKQTGQFFQAPLGELGSANLHRLLKSHSAQLTERRSKHGTLQVHCMYGTYTSTELDAARDELWFAADKSVTVYIEEDARFALVVPRAFPDRAYPVRITNRDWLEPHILELRVICRRAGIEKVSSVKSSGRQLTVGVALALTARAKSDKRAQALVRRQSMLQRRSDLGEFSPFALTSEQISRLLEELSHVDAQISEDDEEDESPEASVPTAAPALPQSPEMRRKPRDDVNLL